ncbi:MAG: hypothetical protein ACK51D_11265, partial [Cyclobacteriaceae bacterium]
MPELRISRLAILLIFICLVVCIQYGMSREQSMLLTLSLIHISEPTRRASISYACLLYTSPS